MTTRTTDGDATHHRQGNAVRKRKWLEGSKEARDMKIKRAADDIRDFFKERFPDGMYGEMGVAAIGHILEHNPNEHKKDKKEKEWKEFLVNVSSKSDIPRIYEGETLDQIQERWRTKDWGLRFLTCTGTTKRGYQKALNLLSKDPRVLSEDDTDEQDHGRNWATWYLKYGTAMPTICPRDDAFAKAKEVRMRSTV